MKYLLDTNIVSELRKGTRMDPGLARWFDSIQPGDCVLSVLVVGELRKGIELLRLRDDTSAQALDRWMTRLVNEFGNRILDLDLPTAELWGRMNVPDPRPAIDGLIGATAMRHGLTLVTRNEKDFGSEVSVLNPMS